MTLNFRTISNKSDHCAPAVFLLTALRDTVAVNRLLSQWSWVIQDRSKESKAMKSSPLFRLFDGLKLCGFSLLKIKIGWVLWYIKVEICKRSYCQLMLSSLLFTNLNFDKSEHPNCPNFLQSKGLPSRMA